MYKSDKTSRSKDLKILYLKNIRLINLKINLGVLIIFTHGKANKMNQKTNNKT